MASPDTEIFDAVARSNVNSVWGCLTMEVLARLGVQTVVTSPGSRSTPLTLAAARNPRIEALSILDERSAAFYALGLAKRTRRTVALVCTSGSAAANYWPAVVEASMGGTPLLLLTADRPAELRGCSSGQTIDQLKLYGDYVRHFVDIALPEVSEGMLHYLRQTLVHAVGRALAADSGPVHLNFPFRDPLAPSEDSKACVIEASVLEAVATVLTRPCEAVPSGGSLDLVALERLSSHSRGIIVVGTEHPRCGDEAFADAVAMISDKLGWPVLTDVLNPLRQHAGENPLLVTHYDAFLRDPEAAEAMRPTAVLQIGALPTSKVLRAWLGSQESVSFLLSSRPTNLDPLHRVAVPLQGDAHDLAEHLKHQRVEPDWSSKWATVEKRSASRIDARMEAMDSLFEGKVAWLLAKYLPVATPVFLASSMSVRYAEYFWTAGSRAYSIFFNRGANGIDGTLSTALGVAHGGKPTVLLTGDLAFLHDSNGLLAASALKGSLTVILINNSGGGIFEHLPISKMEPPFEAFFVTPQSVDFEQLMKAYGFDYELIEGWDQLIAAVTRLPSSSMRLLEIRTDRKINQATLKSLLRFD